MVVLPNSVSAQKTSKSVQNIRRPLPSAHEGGLLAERVELWRKDRLWRVADDGYLLSGYESRPGVHAWQGEHVGKWLHAATLAYEQTHDKKLGKAKIKVTGNYPLSPKAEISFEQAGNKKFALEFTNPGGARLKTAQINGKDIALSKNDRGFYRIDRTWKTGDRIAIEFEYLLKTHTETPKNGQRWVAFTYGPWSLAQKIKKGAAGAEPFIGKDVKSKAPSQWLAPYQTRDKDLPLFRIKNTNILLEPYCSAGGKKTGIRTYFKF